MCRAINKSQEFYWAQVSCWKSTQKQNPTSCSETEFIFLSVDSQKSISFLVRQHKAINIYHFLFILERRFYSKHKRRGEIEFFYFAHRRTSSLTRGWNEVEAKRKGNLIYFCTLSESDKSKWSVFMHWFWGKLFVLYFIAWAPVWFSWAFDKTVLRTFNSKQFFWATSLFLHFNCRLLIKLRNIQKVEIGQRSQEILFDSKNFNETFSSKRLNS